MGKTSRIIDCNINQEQQHKDASIAMQELTIAGFRLYSYLCSMAQLEGGRSIFQLCQDDVCEYTGMSADRYYCGVRDLEKHGYIKPKAGKRRYYLFNGRGE